MINVSVIVPSFNRCDLLKRALYSVVKQSYSEYEVIVVDDGSTDGTAAMVAKLFPEINYIYQSNSGVSSARNKGLEFAKGEWMAFLDSDDEWLPTKLEEQISKLKELPDYKVCHTEEQWIRNGSKVNQMKKHKKQGGWIFAHCLPLCAMSPSSIVIHRSVFEQVGNFDKTLPACEDYDLWLRISAKFPVIFIEKPLILKYGGHDDQLSRKYWGMDRFRIQALQNIISGNDLSDSNRHEAVTMLLKKCKIMQQGALKREKIDAVKYYQEIIVCYES